MQILIATLFFVVAAALGDAGAAELAVGGSWTASCPEAALSGFLLRARCLDTAGKPQLTSLDLLTCGQPASAGNNNGQLVCESGERRPAVGGSWSASCGDDAISGSTLTATCLDGSGAKVAASLDLNDCNEPATAGNQNGQLVCESGTRTAEADAPAPDGGSDSGTPDAAEPSTEAADLPEGSWAQSCADASVDGTTLRAKCGTVAGDFVDAALDLRRCKQPIAVGNSNGKLICESGLAVQINLSRIGGSWSASCRQARVSGSILTAKCGTKAGMFIDSVLDLRACATPFAVHNIDGKLVCGS